MYVTAYMLGTLGGNKGRHIDRRLLSPLYLKLYNMAPVAPSKHKFSARENDESENEQSDAIEVCRYML